MRKESDHDGPEAGTAIDITWAIDDGPVSPLLVQTGILCAVVAVLVELDTSSINVAAPLIARRLGLSQAHLGPIFSAALLGSLLSALSFGSLADRLGRKRMLVVATLALASSRSPPPGRSGPCSWCGSWPASGWVAPFRA